MVFFSGSSYSSTPGSIQLNSVSWCGQEGGTSRKESAVESKWIYPPAKIRKMLWFKGKGQT